MNRMAPAQSRWDALLEEFLACHERGLNVFIHLFTVGLSVWAAFVLLGMAWAPAGFAVSSVLLALLVRDLPAGVWGATAAALGGLSLASWFLPVAWPVAAGALVASVVVQELAHLVTSEPTLQSTYITKKGAIARSVEHTLFLVPLTLAAAWECELLEWLVARRRIVHTALPERDHTDLDRVHDWVKAQEPSPDTSHHWWRTDLPDAERAAFDRIRLSPRIMMEIQDTVAPGFRVESVMEMDEVYVAGPDQELTSDTVFHTAHVDGPWSVFPFGTLMRCLVAVSDNHRVTTHFPVQDHNGGTVYKLERGQALAFDYHRELHYIQTDTTVEPTSRRVVAKLHYVVYPEKLRSWGHLLAWMSTTYNRTARNLFLDTIQPKTVREKLGAWWVVSTTEVFDGITRWMGTTNLAYILLLAAISAATWNPLPLLIGGSFVHYLIYIGTFAHRGTVSHQGFVRDAIFFKTVSLVLLTLAAWFTSDAQPVPLLVAALGFGLSAFSARRLGSVRTWFGVELGQVPPERIDRFPYGSIPHPMILGSMVGFIGVGMLSGLTEAFPWLVPAHVVLYLVHLLQETQAEKQREADARAGNTLDLD